MNFIAIDFETANGQRGSACSIGLAFVENGNIVRTEHYLIKPIPNHFDGYNVYLHGITAEMVANAPTFAELWESKLKQYFEGNMIVAHNASFDMSVMRYALNDAGLKFPNADYFCTMIAARAAFFELFNYQLTTVCEEINYSFENHHNAEADAIACANIVLSIALTHNCNSIDELIIALDLCKGIISDCGEYKPCRQKVHYHTTKLSEINYTIPANVDVNNPLYAKKVAITGTLASMTRINAQIKILQSGGCVANSLTMDTNYLVCGGFDIYAKGFESIKIKKAKANIAQGLDLEIINENEFLQLLCGN